MQEYKTIKILNFFCAYFLVLTLITSYFGWFHGDVVSILLLFILIGAGYLFTQVFYTGKRVERLNEKAPQWHLYALLIVGIVGAPEIYTSGFSSNFVVCCLFYIGAIVMYFLWKHYNGRNLVLCQNPSVTENTKKRSGNKMKRTMLGILFIAVLTGGTLVVVTGFLPDLEWEQKTISHEEERGERERTPASIARDKKELPVQAEERKIPEAVALILRYVLWGVGILICVATITFLVYRLLISVRDMGKGETEYEEIVVEENDNEEYTRLVPIKKKGKEFSKDNNGKVRQAFYRNIKEQAEDRKVDASLTPQELEERYLSKVTSHEELTNLYEKARYGESPITDDEIEKMGL